VRTGHTRRGRGRNKRPSVSVRFGVDTLGQPRDHGDTARDESTRQRARSRTTLVGGCTGTDDGDRRRVVGAQLAAVEEKRQWVAEKPQTRRIHGIVTTAPRPSPPRRQRPRTHDRCTDRGSATPRRVRAESFRQDACARRPRHQTDVTIRLNGVPRGATTLALSPSIEHSATRPRLTSAPITPVAGSAVAVHLTWSRAIRRRAGPRTLRARASASDAPGSVG